jgi:DinB superfamily
MGEWNMTLPPELRQLEDQLDTIVRNAQELVSGLTEERAGWRATPDSWSVSQCLDHLAIGNRVYLGAMQPAALRAREQGRHRRGPALPGIVGRLFVGALEPPVKFLFPMKSPQKIRPRAAPSLAEALAAFVASQNEVRSFLHENADLDLAAVRFPNPFVPGIRFSLATGLHVIAAHERRHLWQARRVRCIAQDAVAGQPSNSV